jgi:hypothetical protein
MHSSAGERAAEPTTHAQVAAAKTLVHVASAKPTHMASTKPTGVATAKATHMATAEAAHVTAAEAAAHVTAAKSPTAARVGGIGAEAPAESRGR